MVNIIEELIYEGEGTGVSTIEIEDIDASIYDQLSCRVRIENSEAESSSSLFFNINGADDDITTFIMATDEWGGLNPSQGTDGTLDQFESGISSYIDITLIMDCQTNKGTRLFKAEIDSTKSYNSTRIIYGRWINTSTNISDISFITDTTTFDYNITITGKRKE